MTHKRAYGQFFTRTNPFLLFPFRHWLKSCHLPADARWVEPFAGENGIISMMRDVPGYESANWFAYDKNIQKMNLTPDVPIRYTDTIASFPGHFDIAVTNPPYLAKNSATRRHLPYAGEPYADVYLRCLEVMLDNCDRVAAIIPESFVTSGLFRERLDIVISLTCKMFSDTECPVCLACFGHGEHDDFDVYQNETHLGRFSEMEERAWLVRSDYLQDTWRFNDPKGTIGIRCVDGTGDSRIRFVPGDEIPSSKVRPTSRSVTRVGGCPDDVPAVDVIERCNLLLDRYRKDTADVLLTSFKGLRKDGFYRRRLDFACARGILCTALEELETACGENMESE